MLIRQNWCARGGGDLNIAEYSKAGKRVVIDLGDNHLRLASDVFEIPGGLVFADSGWPDAAGRHPFHVLKGEVEFEELGDTATSHIHLSDDVVTIRGMVEEGDEEYVRAWTEHQALDGTRVHARAGILQLFPELEEVSE
ncbi:hypothetical protein ACFL1S_08490 [Pseudomonadota bacterium]